MFIIHHGAAYWSRGGLGMSCRLRHPNFCTVGVPLDRLIHDFGGCGRVSWDYSPRLGMKGLAFVRFHVIEKKPACVTLWSLASCWSVHVKYTYTHRILIPCIYGPALRRTVFFIIKEEDKTRFNFMFAFPIPQSRFMLFTLIFFAGDILSSS